MKQQPTRTRNYFIRNFFGLTLEKVSCSIMREHGVGRHADGPEFSIWCYITRWGDDHWTFSATLPVSPWYYTRGMERGFSHFASRTLVSSKRFNSYTEAYVYALTEIYYASIACGLPHFELMMYDKKSNERCLHEIFKNGSWHKLI
jgi:hypothetical protein